jgi:hypothetical protein
MLAAQSLEQREQRLEHRRLRGAVAFGRGEAAGAELRQQLGQRGARGRRELLRQIGAALGELARDRPQRVDQRRVGDRGAAELETVPDERARTRLAGARLELRDQPALADSGLARHEGERRNARRRAAERAVESGELVRAADERG